MRQPLVILALGMLLCSVLPAFKDCRGEAPEPLPDLYINGGDIRFYSFGYETYFVSHGFYYITVNVTVHNAGPVPTGPVDVSFYLDGRLVGTAPSDGNMSAYGPGNITHAEMALDLIHCEVGDHAVRVEAFDALGDADPADNSAERIFTIYPDPPAISIRFNTASQTAKVSPTSPGVVTFLGDLQVDYGEGPVAITLSASEEMGWHCQLSLSSLIVNDSFSHGFCVTVTVPAATSNAVFGQLTVNAVATAGGLTTDAHSRAIIAVDPYFVLVASARRSNITLTPGETAVFEVALQNNGNSVDGYSVEVEDRAELERRGWNVTISKETQSRVGAGENRTLTVVLRPRDDWAPYKNDAVNVKLKVSSLNSKNYYQDVNVTLSLRVEQKGFFMPSVTLISIIALLAAAISGAAAYALRRRKKKKTAADFNRELHIDD
jgi:hypothetical protein